MAQIITLCYKLYAICYKPQMACFLGLFDYILILLSIIIVSIPELNIDQTRWPPPDHQP